MAQIPKFGIWATLYGLNKLESRQKILMSFNSFFWLGHDLGSHLGPNLVGLNGARKAQWARFGPYKKIRLIIRTWVRV